MVTAIGLLELCVFLYLTSRTLRNTDFIVDNIIFCFLCEIFNYKFFNSVPWLKIGISLYASDFLVLLMLFILVCLKTKLTKNWFTYLWIIFFLLTVGSLIRGVLAYGFSSNFYGDLRKYLYFLIGIIYFLYVPIKTKLVLYEKKIDRLFVFLSAYIWLAIIFHFMGSSLGSYGNLDRPLLADYAIIMAIYTAYKWYKGIVVENKISFLAVLFSITLVVNRFNTTWVALLIGIALILLLKNLDKKSENTSAKLLGQTLILITLLLIVYQVAGNSDLMSSVSGNLDKFNLDESNTFSSRVKLWTAAINTINFTTLTIGQPMGSGMYFLINGSSWQYSIHNGYLEILFRTGIGGLISIVTCIFGIIIMAIKRKRLLPLSVCAMILVYWVAYNITFEQGMLIGLCGNYILFGRDKDEMDNIY